MLTAIAALFAWLCLVTGVVAVVQLFRRRWKSLGIWGGVSLMSFVLCLVSFT